MPQYEDIKQQINTGDTHPLKHGATSKNIYASSFSPEHSGISDQLKLIDKVTQDQRDGEHALSEYIIHLIFMGSAEDKGPGQKKKGLPKSWVLSQTKWGMFTTKIKPRYGSGSVTLVELHQVVMGTTKRMTSSVVPMRRSAQGTTSSIKLQREKTESQWKSFIDSKYQTYLETGTQMEKDTFQTWTDSNTYRETLQQWGEDPWWQRIKRYKVAIESRGQDNTPYFILSPPRGLRKGAKRSYQWNTGKHQNPKPKQRETPWKCLWINTEGKWGVLL